MKKKNIIFFLLLILVSYSCKTNDPEIEYRYNTNPTYTWGYAEFYGAYYSDFKILNNVVSLSLFSDSLYIDEENELAGLGQYLFLEDIFISPNDTILPEGEYKIAENGNPYTFYKGEEFAVDDVEYNIGSFVLYLEKNQLFTVQRFISSGSFIVSNQGNTQQISCDFTLSDSTKIQGNYRAELPYYDQSLKTPSGVPRQKLVVKDLNLAK
jgi:hypothetical protein